MTLLVCGGMPKSGTTFLFTEFANYSNVHRSLFKEIGLFKKESPASEKFLSKVHNSNHIFLDFYPEYYFSMYSLDLLISKRINAFFIIRDWYSYRKSLLKYLKINNMENKYLVEDISYSDYLFLTKYIKDNFLFFSYADFCCEPKSITKKVSDFFGLDIGFRENNFSRINSSDKKNYYFHSFINKYFARYLCLKKYFFMYI